MAAQARPESTAESNSCGEASASNDAPTSGLAASCAGATEFAPSCSQLTKQRNTCKANDEHSIRLSAAQLAAVIADGPIRNGPGKRDSDVESSHDTHRLASVRLASVHACPHMREALKRSLRCSHRRAALVLDDCATNVVCRMVNKGSTVALLALQLDSLLLSEHVGAVCTLVQCVQHLGYPKGLAISTKRRTLNDCRAEQSTAETVNSNS